MTQIEMNGISKVINKNAVLQNISIKMEAGKIYGLQGINGSGKTMLMRMILGLIHPTEGDVVINGKVLGRELEFPQSVGFLLETPTFLNRYSGYDNLRLLAEMKKLVTEEEIREVLCKVGLDSKDKKKYRKYSLGMKQRLGIAAAIMENPDIIILDEPTNALDTEGVQRVKNILYEQKTRGALIVISCHDLNILREVSDEIIRLENGKIVEHMIPECEQRRQGC